MRQNNAYRRKYNDAVAIAQNMRIAQVRTNAAIIAGASTRKVLADVVPADLSATLSNYDTRITALETP